MQSDLAVKITITNDDGSNFISGSGCLYNPQNNNQMYVLTAAHCLIGKEQELKDILDIRNIKIQRNIKSDEGSMLNVIDYHLYPGLDNDLAVVIVEAMEDVIKVSAANVEAEIGGTFYGFPHEVNEGVLLDCKVMTMETIDGGGTFQIKADETLDTFEKSAAHNVQGLSGSGVYRDLNNEKRLIGIVTEIGSPTVTFSRLNCEGVFRFNYILEKNGYELIPYKKPKSKIEIELDDYDKQFEARISRIGNEDQKLKVLQSKKEVYDLLIEMDEKEVKKFLFYYHHSSNNREEIYKGIGELWEIITYIHGNSKSWNLLENYIANLEINYNNNGSNKEFIKLIYSLEMLTMPMITIELGNEFLGTPNRKSTFDNLWIIDNYKNTYDDENICIKCGQNEKYPFRKLLKDFSELDEKGLLKGIESKNNTYEELGDISVVCSQCIRKIGGDILIRGKDIEGIWRAVK